MRPAEAGTTEAPVGAEDKSVAASVAGAETPPIIKVAMSAAVIAIA